MFFVRFLLHFLYLLLSLLGPFHMRHFSNLIHSCICIGHASSFKVAFRFGDRTSNAFLKGKPFNRPSLFHSVAIALSVHRIQKFHCNVSHLDCKKFFTVGFFRLVRRKFLIRRTLATHLICIACID